MITKEMVMDRLDLYYRCISDIYRYDDIRNKVELRCRFLCRIRRLVGLLRKRGWDTY